MFAATPSLRSGGENLERILPAHIHPMADGSLHAALPPEVAQEAIRIGWAEQHPVARMGYLPQNVVMIYAPRDAQEIEIVARLVDEAYHYASGAHPSLPYALLVG